MIWTKQDYADVVRLRESGLKYVQVAARYGVTKGVIAGILRRASGAPRSAPRDGPAAPRHYWQAHDDSRYIETWEARKARRAREATA